MKHAVAALFLIVASAKAADPRRKRTEPRHTSLEARAPSDQGESYDPFLGMGKRRKLDGHSAGSMSMSMSMPDEPEPEDSVDIESGAAYFGAAVSALAAAGAMALI